MAYSSGEERHLQSQQFRLGMGSGLKSVLSWLELLPIPPSLLSDPFILDFENLGLSAVRTFAIHLCPLLALDTLSPILSPPSDFKLQASSLTRYCGIAL